MDTLGKRVSFRRRILGLSQRQLGDTVGMSQQAIDKVESDHTKRPRKLLELSRALDVEPYDLLHGTNTESLTQLPSQYSKNSASSAPDQPSSKKDFSNERDLPVMGRAQGGPDGNLIMNDDAIDWTFRPADLQGVNEAFAAYVTGNSMMPKYEDGDLVYVHPNRPIRKGRYVLVETNNHHGLVKKFEKWEGDHLIVSQFNPAKELSFHKDDLQRVMLIIGSLDQ